MSTNTGKALRITERLSSGNYMAVVPDPSLVAVPSVAQAIQKVIDTRGAMRDSRRERDAAKAAAVRARTEMEEAAAAAVIEGGKVKKGIRKALLAAEEELAEAEVAVEAYRRGFIHAFTAMTAQLEVHREAMEDAALVQAQRALDVLASAMTKAQQAEREAAAAFGLTGLYAAHDATGGPFVPIVREEHVARDSHLAAAVQSLTVSVGELNLGLQRSTQRIAASRAAKPAPEVDRSAVAAAAVQARRAARRAE